MAEFAGKAAFVTGGSSGIGSAAAQLLAERGARALRWQASTPHEVDAAARRVRGRGVTAVLGAPSTSPTRTPCAPLVDRAADEFGGLDVVVTAAGVQRYGTAESTTAAEWDEVLRVNLTGAFLTVHHALPHLRRAAAARSSSSRRSRRIATQTQVAGYTTSKSALNGFARSVAVDEAPYGIRANAVCPGSVDTPMLRAAARRFSDGTDAGGDRLIERVGADASAGTGGASGGGRRGDRVPGERRGRVSSPASAVPVDGGLLAAAGVVLP